MMGVEHFFIYDKGVQRTTKVLLQPFIDRKLVSHIPFPDLHWPGMRKQNKDSGRPSIQEIAYGHCVAHYRQHCRFLLKIDIDEFVYPAQQRHATIVEAMRELDLQNTTEIEIPRTEFGSSHHQRKPDGLVIESYTKASPLRYHHKSIGNTELMANQRLSHPHHFAYRRWARQPFSGVAKVHAEAAHALFRLNHYCTKSLEEHARKGMMIR